MITRSVVGRARQERGQLKKEDGGNRGEERCEGARRTTPPPGAPLKYARALLKINMAG